MRRAFVAAFLVASACLATVGISPAVAQTQRVTPQSKGEALLSFSPVVKQAQPAVVNVYASRTDVRPRNPLFDDPIFERFFGRRGEQPGGPTAQSLGSGVIVEAAGFVVTNNHVIDGMTDVKVALADKREFEADIVLRDPRTDLAVLKIKNGGAAFPTLELGDSDALEVGDLVLALGNPFGVGQTVTQGIVSALARTNVGTSDYGFFIQTDAAINPGNSGVALVDMHARLIGVNSAIYSKSGGSVGIGFAIPVNMVKTVVAAAKSGGKLVRRPWLGATMQNVSKEIADSLGLDRPTGALITDLVEKSPAAEAGLKRGDLIVSIDGQSVADPEALGFRLGTKPLGGAASLSVLRAGKQIVAPIKLVVAPETPARDAIKLKSSSPLRGATVINLSPAVVEEFGVEGLRAGVIVGELDEGSNAQAMNFQKGDVILAVNDTKIANTRDVETATAKGRYLWKITIGRNGQVFTTVVGG